MQITLKDGQALSVHDSTNGTAAVVTMLWFHGSPQTGAILEPHLVAAKERQIRWVSYARPSYGGSTDRLGRSVGDAASDVQQVADALGIDRFAAIGASGGGPHALACAALLGDRVWSAATFASLAPITTDFDWFAGMAANGPSLRAAQRGRVARELFEQTAKFDEGSFNAHDYAALNTRWASLSSDVAEASSDGPEGLIADDLAFVSPWGAELAAIRCPVLIAHGGDDRVVPPSHAHRLVENVRDGELWLRPRDGHISILDASVLAMDWLLNRA
jgi:pimeloyl-ACP methyl ester carboxylesterase